MVTLKINKRVSVPALAVLIAVTAFVGVYLTFFSSAASCDGFAKGDLDCSSKVDISDLSKLLSNYGKTVAANTVADVNGDGKVSITDLSTLLSNYGKDVTVPQITATVTGAEQTVVDWSTKRCEDADRPDLPARAFRDSSGQVNLIASHYITRRNIGPDLNNVHHDCAIVMNSHHNSDPSKYDDYEWMGAPYTLDGNTVYALVHNEFHANERPALCPSQAVIKCNITSITSAISTNGGKTFTHQAAPGHLVATIPYKYAAPGFGQQVGYFEPTNIVTNHPADGYYYTLIRAGDYQLQKMGVCVMRTKNLADPKSWRAWDGKGYNIAFTNPYLSTPNPAAQTCPVVSYPQIESMNGSLTFNTYLNRFVLTSILGLWVKVNGQWVLVNGVYYSTSTDLVNWTQRQLLFKALPRYAWKAGDPDPISYPSLLDPTSTSRNFETTGQTAYIYFTRYISYGVSGHNINDTDLIRVPVRFNKQ